MDRLIGYQLLQQRCGTVPGDPAQFEEPDIEPVLQQRLEVGFQRRQQRVVTRPLQQLRPHVHQEFHPFRQAVELGQQTHPAGLKRAAQRPLGMAPRNGVGGLVEDIHRPVHGGAVHVEVTRQHAEEIPAARRIESQICPPQLGGAGPRAYLAAASRQASLHLDAQPVGILTRQVRARRGADGFAGESGDIAPSRAQIFDCTVEQRRSRLFFDGGR